MIENLETLVQLSITGTMMETATRLKISQSAVSKRIASLEGYYDRKLVERHGRLRREPLVRAAVRRLLWQVAQPWSVCPGLTCKNSSS